jgi:hypothetical protein
MTLSRRAWLVGSAAFATGLAARVGGAAEKPAITVYKSPT